MQPSPMVDTSRSLPSLRFCIVSPSITFDLIWFVANVFRVAVSERRAVATRSKLNLIQQDSLPSLNKSAPSQVQQSLFNLCSSIHHERTIARHRLVQRLARDKQKAHFFFPGFDLHPITIIEH